MRRGRGTCALTTLLLRGVSHRRYLLSDAQELVAQGMLHNALVFNAMVHYLRARGTPFKHRVISLLTQMLKSPHLFGADQVPNLAALRGIERVVLEHCGARIQETPDVMFPSRLLQLVELLTTAHTAERYVDGAVPFSACVPLRQQVNSVHGLGCLHTDT